MPTLPTPVIVGIVSMDVTMIDVTDVSGVEIGDVVTIYGSDGDHLLPTNGVARYIGTVTSDLMCAVSARVTRVYTEYRPVDTYMFASSSD